MSSFRKYLEAKGKANQTAYRYWRDAVELIEWSEKENIEIENLRYNDLLLYIKELQKKGNVQRTIQTKIGSLKHYFKWQIAEEKRTDNPAINVVIKGIHRKKLYEILTKKELEKLYEDYQIPKKEDYPKSIINTFEAAQLSRKRNKVIIGLMVWQGLGSGELGRLEEKDVKLREGKIYIAGSRKTNERTMKLEAHQVLDIMEYTLQTRKELLKLSGKESNKLFVSTGASDEFRSIVTYLMKHLRKQNSKVISMKQIRTSVITHWLKNHNLREVQYMAGHRYVSSTEAYLINDIDDLQEDINKYHPIG